MKLFRLFHSITSLKIYEHTYTLNANEDAIGDNKARRSSHFYGLMQFCNGFYPIPLQLLHISCDIL